MGKVLAPSDTPIRSYRLATEQDLPEIARIHIIAYSRSYFTSRVPGHELQKNCRYLPQSETNMPAALPINCAETGRKRAIEGWSVYDAGTPDTIALFKKRGLRHILITWLKHLWIASWKSLNAGLASVAKKRLSTGKLSCVTNL